MQKDSRDKAGTGQALAVGQFIKDVLAQHPSFASRPLGDWKELVGESVARHCLPRSLKNGCLVIVARDSVWKHHLEMHKEALMERINALWGRRVIEEIRIRVGEIDEAFENLDANYRKLQKVAPKKVRKKNRRPPLRKLTEAEKELLASLPDKELRAIGEKLLRLIPEDPEAS
jgi:hypothetical protein